MAKRSSRTARHQVEQLSDEMLAQVAGPDAAIIELNDFGTNEVVIQSLAMAQADTPDTIQPSPDIFAAAEALEAQFGGLSGLMQAFAETDVDVAGAENILGFGVGLRLSSGNLTDQCAVKVYVREKLPLSGVASSARIPAEIDGVATDVEAIGEVIATSYARAYPLPVPCGVSCGHFRAGSGTIGGLVVLDNNRLAILSNNHVLANENDCNTGDAIIQPGNADRPGPNPSIIGRLERFIPLQSSGNTVDAAVAWTSTTRVDPRHMTYVLNATPLAPSIGMTVTKNGRTTQATTGMVTDVGVSVSVRYSKAFPGGAAFRNQIVVRGVQGLFSSPGDSGSLIVTAGTKQPVALLFAGGNGVTFANPIGAVMTQLGIKRFYVS